MAWSTLLAHLWRDRFWPWLISDPSQFILIVLGLAALFVGFRQVGIMGKQTTMMGRQMDLMRRQDEIIAADRARRTFLELDITKPNSGRIQIAVSNAKGTLSAKKFYWHLYIPCVVMAGTFLNLDDDQPTNPMQWNRQLNQAGTPEEINGVNCFHYTALVERPVFPTEKLRVASIAIQSSTPRGKHVVYWETLAEDGRRPQQGRESTTIEI